MPQLDRVLLRLDGGAASEVVLEADAPIRCVTPAGTQAVTQQLLNREQLLALVAEVASPADRASVNAGANVRVQYALNGQSYVFTQDTASPTLRISVRRADVAPMSFSAPTATESPTNAASPVTIATTSGEPERQAAQSTTVQATTEAGGERRAWRRRAPLPRKRTQRRPWNVCCACR